MFRYLLVAILAGGFLYLAWPSLMRLRDKIKSKREQAIKDVELLNEIDETAEAFRKLDEQPDLDVIRKPKRQESRSRKDKDES